ncbi:YitT family protein [Streptococcus massiliensis]|uniref:YitT family protein n=1 Tax=Streptococcus massiliensis TaxID=313439 RepID=A0A380L0L6_9STRE|nr:YitT family protein [Streptococcus massiliensis]SUN76894.1 YitT family protein [Streptococcus massiliensis]
MKIKNALVIILGAAIFAFGINYLVIPNHLYEGGATGITLITYYLLKIPVSLMNLVINIPLFILAWRLLGARTLYYSLLGTFSVSAWLYVFERIPFIIDLDNDILITSLLAGLMSGVGLGIIFNAGGTTGGTDIVARIVGKYSNFSIGRLMLIVDACVLLFVLLVFKDTRMVVYTLIFVFIAARIIDLIAEGGGYAGKGFLIVTPKWEELAQIINKELVRGVTLLNGQGHFTKADYKIIYCVVARNEIRQMKEIIAKVDPHAFTTITDAHEILGEGFTLDENKQPIQR